MNIVQHPAKESVKKEVGSMPAGTVVINGEGNICMVCRPEADKIRIVNLHIGGVYSVLPTCRYEVVDATLTWSYK